MSWFKKWFAPEPAVASPEAAPAPAQGQVRMSLEERMALRQEMVFEAAKEVMRNHGIPAAGFRLNAVRQDERGHSFAVMVDLLPLYLGRPMDSPGEWQAMEAQVALTAKSRYRVKVSHVYWRFEGPINNASSSVSRAPVTMPTAPVPEVHTPPVESKSAASSLFGKKPPAQEDFPDTQIIDDRAQRFEGVSPEELLAFEEAIRQGQGTAEQPVRVGKRHYQTDFMPLD